MHLKLSSSCFFAFLLSTFKIFANVFLSRINTGSPALTMASPTFPRGGEAAETCLRKTNATAATKGPLFYPDRSSDFLLKVSDLNPYRNRAVSLRSRLLRPVYRLAPNSLLVIHWARKRSAPSVSGGLSTRGPILFPKSSIEANYCVGKAQLVHLYLC